MSDYLKVLAALDASGVEGLAAGQYRPDPAEFIENGGSDEVSPKYGCLLYAVYGKATGEPHSWVARAKAPAYLGVKEMVIEYAEVENDFHEGGARGNSNSDAACVRRLAHMREWLARPHEEEPL